MEKPMSARERAEGMVKIEYFKYESSWSVLLIEKRNPDLILMADECTGKNNALGCCDKVRKTIEKEILEAEVAARLEGRREGFEEAAKITENAHTHIVVFKTGSPVLPSECELKIAAAIRKAREALK